MFMLTDRSKWNDPEFPVYSDRIVQDLHLVPSSDNNCGIVSPALDTAILNYTNNIIDLKREVVNPPFSNKIDSIL